MWDCLSTFKYIQTPTLPHNRVFETFHKPKPNLFFEISKFHKPRPILFYKEKQSQTQTQLISKIFRYQPHIGNYSLC
jgi:hypothetical protein